MKHLLNNLSEEEKNKIRGQHTGGMKVNSDNFNKLTESKLGDVKPLVNEQPTARDLENIKAARYRGGGEGTQGDRDKVTGGFKDVVQDFTIPSGMFLNGVDKIDTNSPEFKDAFNKIKNVITTTGGKVDIQAQGGASAVGSSRGYDNKALANRRRDNFINAIKASLGNLSNRINFISKEGQVGKSTTKNSPEANAEQFVKITYPDKIGIYNQKLTVGPESTDVAQGKLRGKDKEGATDPEEKGNPYMIVKIYYRKGEKETYKKKILDATGSPVRELIDYGAVEDCNLRFR
jgi:hypothetical protein